MNFANLDILLIFHTYIFGQTCTAPQSELSTYAYDCTTSFARTVYGKRLYFLYSSFYCRFYSYFLCISFISVAIIFFSSSL